MACVSGFVVVPRPPRRACLRATRSSDKLEEPHAAPTRWVITERLAEIAPAPRSRARRAAAGDAATGPLGDYAPVRASVEAELEKRGIERATPRQAPRSRASPRARA